MSDMAPTIVITGATSGLGLLAATTLAEAGNRLILPARNPDRAQHAAATIKKSAPNADLDIVLGDLSRPQEVQRLATEIRASHDRVDVLINNAGLHAFEPRVTADGIPEMIAVNYLAPFVLTRELLPALQHAPGGRIVNVASEASRHHGTLNIPDALTDTSGFTPRRSSERYGQSKLLDIMFTLALARRLTTTMVTANCLDPGFNATSLGRELRFAGALERVLRTLRIGDPTRGSGLIVDLATAPTYEGRTGLYITQKGRRELTPAIPAADADAQDQLWDATERLLGQIVNTVPKR